ncbi:hypothetical protein Pam2_172 [Pseudanabaena phage Pam2]|nr:hypothetical protein Pam2_172 [Pseudanabaena phage Pam2]
MNTPTSNLRKRKMLNTIVEIEQFLDSIWTEYPIQVRETESPNVIELYNEYDYVELTLPTDEQIVSEEAIILDEEMAHNT